MRPFLQEPTVPCYDMVTVDVEARALRNDLQTKLMSLSFHAFEACMRDLLSAMGYQDVQMLERTSWRQRTGHGGLDLQAYSEVGVTRARIILQLKQYTRPVSRRFVDELRGTMLRTGARHGMLITTSTFAKAAKKAATGDHYAQVAPIHLIDGDELLDLMFVHRVGVWKECDTPPTDHEGSDGLRYGLDRDYFTGLTEQFPGSTNRGQMQANSPTGAEVARCVEQSHQERQGGEMTWRTHMLAGIASVWFLQLVPGTVTIDNIALLSACAAFGALLPDLDATESKLKSISVAGVQPFSLPSVLANSMFGHRGFLHSFAGLAAIAAVTSCVGYSLGLPLSLAAALVLGYASHLAMDACTISGIPALFPDKRRYHALPKRLRIVTGSPVEGIVLALLVLPVMALLLRQMLLLGPYV